MAVEVEPVNPPLEVLPFTQKDLNYRLSESYKLRDLTSCRAAIRARFDNWPWDGDTTLLYNLANMAQNFLEPMHEIDGTIQILGCWRSQHLFFSENPVFSSYNPSPDLERSHVEGRGVDFFVPGQTMYETVQMIKHFRVPFDLMLLGESEPILAGRKWIHITHVSDQGRQRCKVLQMRSNGALVPLSMGPE